MIEKAGALWLKNGKKGKFLSGQIEINGEKHGVLIFKNKNKREGTKQPDYQIFWAEGKTEKPASQKDEELPFEF